MSNRNNWNSQLGFILSTIGFAVGAGTLWKFPYLVGQNGGAVFLIFYILIVFIIGIPLLCTEISIGKFTKKDPVGAYRKIRPKSFWFLNGYLNIITMLLILGYVSPVVGWIIAYFFKSLFGVFSKMSPSEIQHYFTTFTSHPLEVLLWTSLFFIYLAFILIKGLNNGIEKINKIMLPLLFIIMIILIIRSLTLPGSESGLIFYLKPDFYKFSFEAVTAAVGQAFFSIGVAMGVSIVFGSYMRSNDKIISNGIIVGSSIIFVAFLAGLIIFPIVFAFGLQPNAGFGLTFITMPNVFNKIPFGNIFAGLFFLLFFLASFTSFIGGAEAIVAHLNDEWSISRKHGVYITIFLMALIAIPSALCNSFFELIDYLVSSYFLIIGGIAMSIFAGWVWKLDDFFRIAGVHSNLLKVVWTLLIKYLAPIVLIIVFLSQLGLL
jgi:neurotransmitter:Na+ symporter, NSS family